MKQLINKQLILSALSGKQIDAESLREAVECFLPVKAKHEQGDGRELYQYVGFTDHEANADYGVEIFKHTVGYSVRVTALYDVIDVAKANEQWKKGN